MTAFPDTRPALRIPYQFDGFLCELRIPRDLTTDEAERLCAMIRTLPMPQEQGS